MGKLLDSLDSAASDFDDFFEKQRRGMGEAYRLKNEIVKETKRGLTLLKIGKLKEANEIQTRLFSLMERFENINLPDDVRWQLNAEASQEVVEFHLVLLAFYPYVFENKEFSLGSFEPFISMMNKSYGQTPQACLAGLIDAVSETGKMVTWFFSKGKIAKNERRKIRERFLELIEDAHVFLSRFEKQSDQIVNNTRRQGYGNTFRAQLSRLEHIIDGEREKLAEMVEQEETDALLRERLGVK